MAFYLFLSERHGSGVGSRWAFMGLAVKLGISVRTQVLAWVCSRRTDLTDIFLQMGLRECFLLRSRIGEAHRN